MITFFFISSVAMLVGIVGSIVIWRFDALRAEEIAHTPRLVPVSLPQSAQPAGAIEGSQPPAAA